MLVFSFPSIIYDNFILITIFLFGSFDNKVKVFFKPKDWFGFKWLPVTSTIFNVINFKTKKFIFIFSIGFNELFEAITSPL